MMKYPIKNIVFLSLILVLFAVCKSPYSSETKPIGAEIPEEIPEDTPGDTPGVSYTITYLNMEAAANHSSNPGTYTSQSQAITLGSPVKANVYFVCWRLNTSTGAPVSSIPAESTGNKTFFAQWTTEEEFNVIAETNRVRTDPNGYANMLQAELSGISATDIRNQYEAAIATLNSAVTRNPLNFERGLYFAARAHAEDLIKSNTASHNSSDGTEFSQRIKLFGTSYTSVGENLAGGTNQNTGSKMVKQWVLSPGHLDNILHANFTQLGASLMSGHPTYTWVSVQVFGRNFVSNQF